MGIWRPDTDRKMVVLDIATGDTPTWSYKLAGHEIAVFPDSSVAVMEFKNSFGQTVGSWTGSVVLGVVTFPGLTAADGDALTRGTTFTLTITDVDGRSRQPLWGSVTRNEARYPDNPDNSTAFDGVVYDYAFNDAGFLVDPAFTIMNGHPRIYDNSLLSLPNAVAAGSLAGGDLTVFDDVAMLYYAPVKGDAVRLTYNTIRSGAGQSWIAICSNYDMSNYAAFRHTGVFLSGLWQHDTVDVVTGTGPVTIVSRVTPVNHNNLTNQNYTAEYNPASNTYSLYAGTSLTPLVSWVDSTNIVDHGDGEQYVGFGFKSDLLTPGVEVSDWTIASGPGVGPAS